MTKQEKQNRIQFLQALQTAINAVTAQLVISANRIGSKVVEGSYNLKNRKNVTKLLVDLDRLQDEERLNVYTTFRSGIGNMMGLSINQLQQTLNKKKVGVDLSGVFATLDDRISRFLVDNEIGALLTKIWTPKDKEKIIETVLKAISEDKTAFQLAEDLTKTVSSGAIRSNIDRVANTELVRAYNKASYDTVKENQNTLGQDFDTYIEVFLSPYHPEEDICDDLVGTYEVGNAPIPPHHPNCICGYKEILLPKGKGVALNGIDRSSVPDIKFY